MGAVGLARVVQAEAVALGVWESAAVPVLASAMVARQVVGLGVDMVQVRRVRHLPQQWPTATHRAHRTEALASRVRKAA